jgi:hypothetical protein
MKFCLLSVYLSPQIQVLLIATKEEYKYRTGLKGKRKEETLVDSYPIPT